MALRSLGRLNGKSTLFLLCDLQERFRSLAVHFPAIVTNAQKLINCGKQLDVKLIVSEQNPVKLGATVPELSISHAIAVHPKLEFSMMSDARLRDTILSLNTVERIDSVVLFGLETHICIEQTAMDLLDYGYEVHVVADCTTSRSPEDRALAFERLRQIGCYVTSSENVVFKLLRGKSHPQFAHVRPMLQHKSIESGLVTSATDSN